MARLELCVKICDITNDGYSYDLYYLTDRCRFWSEEDHFQTLELSHARLDDCGEFCATARNAHGAVTCRATLVVDKGIRAYVAPEFLFELEPASATAREGDQLILSAHVEAYPAVGVMW